MKFIIKYKKQEFLGRPIYFSEQMSFMYEPWRENNYSLMLGAAYTSLDINLEDMTAVQISGCNPKRIWKKCNLTPPTAKEGVLNFVTDEELLPGSGFDYSDDWQTLYNPKNGWICLGNPYYNNLFECVKFARDTIAVVQEGKLTALWVCPVFK